MKKKDIYEMQAVCALYTMCYLLKELLDEVADELPPTMANEIELLRNGLNAVSSRMEDYNEGVRDLFFAACDDCETEARG